jgi:hypothetical protein
MSIIRHPNLLCPVSKFSNQAHSQKSRLLMFSADNRGLGSMFTLTLFTNWMQMEVWVMQTCIQRRFRRCENINHGRKNYAQLSLLHHPCQYNLNAPHITNKNLIRSWLLPTNSSILLKGKHIPEGILWSSIWCVFPTCFREHLPVCWFSGPYTSSRCQLLKGSAKQLEDSSKIVEHFCVWRGSYQKLTQ